MSHPLLDEIAKTSVQLMLKEPFYGHFFSAMLKDVGQGIDSMSLSLTDRQMLHLSVNPDYWEKILRDERDPEHTKALRYGGIKHQLLHAVLKHVFRVKEFGNRKLFNIASDIAVNQYIEQRQMPKSAIRLEQFPEFKLQPGQGLDYYYKRLAEEFDQMQSSPFPGDQDPSDEPDEGDSNSGGSGKDPHADPDPEGQGSASSLNTAQQRLQELLGDEENTELQQHEEWDRFNKLSPAERRRLEANMDQAIVDAAQRIGEKMLGLLPLGLQQYLTALAESLRPNVHWRRMLRLFAAGSSRTGIRNTLRRPSKRYGTSPGIKIQRKNKILVAIDTSGSVSDEELREFFGELYHIWKQGTEILVVECDAAIHKSYPYKGKMPEVISGRGGTDFNAPLKFANEQYLPDALIYFTDGYADAPRVVCRKPLLWLISSKGIDSEKWDFLPGRKVKMLKQV